LPTYKNCPLKLKGFNLLSITFIGTFKVGLSISVIEESLLKVMIFKVWPKNTIFEVYSKKFRKFPILLKTGIRTPHPMGILQQTLRKCLLKFFCKNRISGRKTRFLQKSDRYTAKIVFFGHTDFQAFIFIQCTKYYNALHCATPPLGLRNEPLGRCGLKCSALVG
jgi:hypothetical protein